MINAPSDSLETLSKRRSFLRKSLAAGPAAAIAASTMMPNTASAAVGTTGYFFNVMDYGATGLGTADDTTAIQAAINAAIAVGGGVVLLPAGKYLVSGSLTLDSSITTAHVTLQGAGPGPIQDGTVYQGGTTILIPTSSANDALVVSYSDSVTIKSLSIVSTSPRSSGRGIYLNGGTNVVIEDVFLKNQAIGIHVYGGYGHRIDRGWWTIPPNGIGLWIDGNSTVGSNDTYINGISCNGGWAAFRIQNTGGAWMSQCDSISSTCGLLIDPIAGQEVLWCSFEACAFDTASNSPIIIGPAGGKVRGLTFVECWSASVTAGVGSCFVIAGDVDGVQIVGQRILNAASGNGLWVSGAKNIYVDSSVAFDLPNGAGFSFVSTTNFAIRNCHSGPYAGLPGNKYGVYIDSGCSHYVVQGCTLNGNTTALTDGGAAPKAVLAGSNLLT